MKYFCQKTEMFKMITSYREAKPLTVILVAAVIVRLIAVVFAKGWGMHDDHFLVIEASQSWVDGTDYNNWLPKNQVNPEPSGHSFFYVGIHYLIFSVLEWIHIYDPQAKMYLVRLLHALFSLITVVYGYRISELISGRKVAFGVGLLLAIFWFFPFLSVRNLVEVVCIPFLIMGSWYILLSTRKADSPKYYVYLAGILLGLAFSVRFQTVFFAIGIGFYLLIKQDYKRIMLLLAGYISALVLTQGPVDMVLWGYPFAEMIAYFEYNFFHAYDYITNPWYSYLLLLAGIMIPPFSLMLFAGFFEGWKRNLLLFLPAFLFLLVHSIFPNKQERFILPFIPFLIILGLDGWSHISEYLKSMAWKKAIKGIMIFFWVLNLILLPVISTTYSKRARVESMTMLGKFKEVKVILMEDTNHGLPKMPPRFYLGQWVDVLELGQDRSFEYLMKNLSSHDQYPRFVLFMGNENLGKRINNLKTIMPGLEYYATAEPGFLDKLMHWLNPVNQNQSIYIYKNTDFIK